MKATYDEYTVTQDRSAGRVEWSRDAEEAPAHIAVTLALIQSAAQGLMTVNRDTLTILGDRYRITGWDGDAVALVCDLETDDR